MRRQPIHAEITGLDVNLRRRSAIGYTAGLALYALVVVALYPAFKHTNSLDTFIQKRQDCRRAVRFGITGTLSSSTRWLNGNPYANFFPLIALLLTIGYRAAAIAGQDEDGTLCLIALPVRRSSIVLEKGAPMALEALVLGAMVAICVIVGRSFQLDTAVSHAITTSLAVLLMALDFGPITMAIGALTGSRATALGIGATLAAASYLSSARSPRSSPSSAPHAMHRCSTDRSAISRSPTGQASPTPPSYRGHAGRARRHDRRVPPPASPLDASSPQDQPLPLSDQGSDEIC